MEAKRQRELEKELSAALGRSFPGLSVEIAHSDRWKRMAVTFRWAGFADLLPEERFHRLVGELPEDILKKKLDGFVWLELTAEESVDEFLELPRSEDVAPKERDICEALKKLKFFDALQESLGRSPQKKCTGDFAKSEAALKSAKAPATRVREAKLVFIRHGAYCDCQVLQTVAPALARQYAKVS